MTAAGRPGPERPTPIRPDGRVPSHYLRANETEWSPGHVLVFDTETTTTEVEGRQLLSLRLWAARHVARKGGEVIELGEATGTDRQSLAAWVDAATVGHRTTWAYCHNLGFDLTVSRLPDFLHRLGWTMGRFNLASRNVSGSMHRNTKRITLCDSVSLVPRSLRDVGHLLGVPKAPMPTPLDHDEAWEAYCRQDVNVTLQLVLTLAQWWDQHQLGYWAKSGPGLGWNAMRHHVDAHPPAGQAWQRLMTPPDRKGKRRLGVVMQRDPARQAADRQAIYGGRRDVTRVGEIPGGPFALVDFASAYLTLAAHVTVPVRRLGHYQGLPVDSTYLHGPLLGGLAHCTVNTPVPRYPLRTPKGVFYPVGRFQTWLAGPEVTWARDSGHLEAVGEAWVHQLGQPFAAWARWALDLLESPDPDVPPVVRAMVKQWGRSVMGRWALRTARVVDRGWALHPGWHLERGFHHHPTIAAADVHIAGRHWWYVFDQESDNNYPAILAWVQSHLRVAQGRMLEALGDDLWVTSDTDSAIIDLTMARHWLKERTGATIRARDPHRVAAAVCDALAPLTQPLTPRVKVLSDTLTVNGPQHYAGDTFHVAAGRPSRPEIDPDGTLRWWVWPKVRWQMGEGSLDGFVRVEANWTAPAQTAHRWVLESGRAIPPLAVMVESGASELAAWDPELVPDGGEGLAEVQAQALARLH